MSEPTIQPRWIKALDHLDPQGSVVRSGMLAAEAVLEELPKQPGPVILSFEGLRGAGSSYFNVFLRRIEEGCGLDLYARRVLVQFGSDAQQMVYNRSLQALRKGPVQPPSTAAPASDLGPNATPRPGQRWIRILWRKPRPGD